MRNLIIGLVITLSTVSCKKDSKCWECTDNTGNSFDVIKKCGASESEVKEFEQSNNYSCHLK